MTRKEKRAQIVAWIRAVASEQGEGCRDWPGAVNNKGYGQVKWEGQYRKVGHLILELSGRPRPSPESCQLHSCDRSSCVAPWHLRWGTLAENSADAVGRGRHAHGSTNGVSKLTEADVVAIRAIEGRTYQSIADDYGVHKTIIGRVRRRQIWTHV